MAAKEITVEAQITPEVFREFALFDTLRRQKRWRRPALFAALMAVFSLVCFCVGDRVRGAVLLGGVLLGVGLVLPVGYFLSFWLSVRERAKQFKGETAYTLHLTQEKLMVSNQTQNAEYPWTALHCAYRLKRCACVFVTPRQAYLLPAQTPQQEEAIWRCLCQYMPQGRAQDLRGGVQ